MGYSIVKINGMPASTQLTEYILDSESDINSLPTNVTDGSSAYTKDLSKIYLFKNGSWTEVQDGPTDAQIKQAVDDWLDDHPEATTTVEDGAISYAKLDSELKAKADDVSDLKSQISDLTGVSNPVSFLTEFAHGNVSSSNGSYTASGYDYRVATPNVTTADATYKLTIAENFRLYLFVFDENGGKVSGGWLIGSQVLAKGTIFRMIIARSTDDTSEVADIATFCSKVQIVREENINQIEDDLANIDSMVPYGCTWDWWITSKSIDAYGNVYIGYVDTDGYAGVMKRQPDGTMQYKRLEKLDNDDDHNAPATIVLVDGKILVIGSFGHAKNNHIICYRSVAPYSVDYMEKLSFDIPETGSYKYSTTYSQIFKYDGKLFDFLRVSVKQNGSTITNGNGYLCLISDDDGDTWTVYKAVQSNDPYISFSTTLDDDKILKAVYTNNPGTRPANMMKGFTFSMDTFEFADLTGTKIGELVLLDGGVIADNDIAHYDDMTDLVQRGDTDKSCRLFYVGKTAKAETYFLYAIATDSTAADWVYKLYADGTVVDIGHSGVPFNGTTYISGACFGKNVDTVIYSKATADDEDGNHELHKVVLSNGSVESDSIITEASICLARPLFLGNGEIAVVTGHYNDNDGSSYTQWQFKPHFVPACSGGAGSSDLPSGEGVNF